MRFDIITIFPEFFKGPFDVSIIKRALEQKYVEIFIHNLRDYTTDKHRQVDDYPYSGEAGMVMKIEPIARAIEHLTNERTYDEIIYPTADGEPYKQNIANHFSTLQNIIILCGHYKGVDQRVIDHYITKEISIGDYVLTGGEIPATILVDSITRLIPGVISDGTSALRDSFQDGLLSPPLYTRPSNYQGWQVPDILRSGNFQKIENWKEEQALERTRKRRPDLLDNQSSNAKS